MTTQGRVSKRGRRATAWLGIACCGLLATSSLSAREPKLRAVLKGHTDSVQSLAFSPTGTLLASASADKTIKLWDLPMGAERLTLEGHAGSVRSVAFNSDGRILASAGEDDTIDLWNVESRKNTAVLRGDQKRVSSVAFSPDGKTLASGGCAPAVQLWDVTTGKKGVALSQGRDAPKCAWSIAFTGDGKSLGGGGGYLSGWAGVWDLTSGAYSEDARGFLQGVFSVAFRPDGKILAVNSSMQGKIELFDAGNRQDSRRTIDASGQGVSFVAFSPDGKTLVSAGKHIVFWDIDTRTPVAVLKAHDASVLAVAFSPDGKTLASGSKDRTIWLWDMPVTRPAER